MYLFIFCGYLFVEHKNNTVYDYDLDAVLWTRYDLYIVTPALLTRQSPLKHLTNTGIETSFSETPLIIYLRANRYSYFNVLK